jgi:hypothetical protein
VKRVAFFLIAACGTAAPAIVPAAAPCPQAPAVSPVAHCRVRARPASPALLDCTTEPSDAPGSCRRINLARRSDYAGAIEAWMAETVVTCQLEER